MLFLAALACLVAVVATLVALVGVWSTPFLWVAAAGFGSAALLSLLAQLLLMTLFTGWSWNLLLARPGIHSQPRESGAGAGLCMAGADRALAVAVVTGNA